MEISKVLDEEFKITVIKILDLRTVDDLSETFDKEVENIKKNHLQLKNSIIVMKNILEESIAV